MVLDRTLAATDPRLARAILTYPPLTFTLHLFQTSGFPTAHQSLGHNFTNAFRKIEAFHEDNRGSPGARCLYFDPSLGHVGRPTLQPGESRGTSGMTGPLGTGMNVASWFLSFNDSVC